MLRYAKIVGSVGFILFAFVYIDLNLRARHAYQEGEKYAEWHRTPAKKKAFFDSRFEVEKGELEASQASGGLTPTEFAQKLELAQFRRDESIAESSLKYSYHWYKTAIELFSPPESRWVRMSRDRMPIVKELWKGELDAKKIPYEEYMLE